MPFPRLRFAVLGAALGLSACRPSGVADAEEKGNVAWLMKRGDTDSIYALGRLADKNAEAERALTGKVSGNGPVYTAAWQAVGRGATWGEKIIRRDLATDVAETVATGMTPGDPRLAAFAMDLESALGRLGRLAPRTAVMLASIGPSARPAVERRIREASTRDAMCSAIDASTASDDARSALLALAPSDRDSLACTAAIVRMAGEHANVRQWLATLAEPGLLSLAGRENLACGPLAETMKIALAERAMDSARALVVPLRHAIERCTRELDGVAAAALEGRPEIAPFVASAMDPRASSTVDMKVTCGWLRAHENQIRESRQIVANLLANGCKNALR